jgi:hypothetical protein
MAQKSLSVFLRYIDCSLVSFRTVHDDLNVVLHIIDCILDSFGMANETISIDIHSLRRSPIQGLVYRTCNFVILKTYSNLSWLCSWTNSRI